jgi:hypothetical protein
MRIAYSKRNCNNGQYAQQHTHSQYRAAASAHVYNTNQQHKSVIRASISAHLCNTAYKAEGIGTASLYIYRASTAEAATVIIMTS